MRQRYAMAYTLPHSLCVRHWWNEALCEVKNIDKYFSANRYWVSAQTLSSTGFLFPWFQRKSYNASFFFIWKTQNLSFLRTVHILSVGSPFNVLFPERLCHVPIELLSPAHKGFSVWWKRLFHRATWFVFKNKTRNTLIYNTLYPHL